MGNAALVSKELKTAELIEPIDSNIVDSITANEPLSSNLEKVSVTQSQIPSSKPKLSSQNASSDLPTAKSLIEGGTEEESETEEEETTTFNSDIPLGTIPGVLLFNEWTNESVFTLAGTAQKTIRPLLGKISSNKSFGGYVFDKGKPNKDTIQNCKSKPTIKRAIKMVEEMLVITNSWLTERGGDKSRENRKNGFIKFSHSLQGFLDSANNQLTNPEINEPENSTESELSKDDILLAQEFEKSSEKAKLHYENRSANSVFQNLEKPISMLAPVANSTGEFEVEIKVPVSTVPGLFLGGNLGLKAENNGDSFNIGSESNLKVGFEGSIPYVIKGEVGVSIGGFIEARSGTIKDTLRLLSYGMYRRVRESKIGRHADALWGGNESAEKFMDRTETDLLIDDSESYVELGGQIALDADVKAKAATFGLEASVNAFAKTGRRYDKNTTKDENGNLRKGKSITETGLNISEAIGAAGWNGTYSFETKRKNITDRNISVTNPDGATQHSAETSISIGATSPPILNSAKLLKNYIALATAIDAKTKTIGKSAKNDNTNLAIQQASQSLETALTSSSDDKLFEAEQDTFGDLKKGVKSESKLGFELKFSFEELENKIVNSSGEGKLSSVNETEIIANFMGAGVAIKASKSEQLLKIANTEKTGFKWKIGK